MISDITVSLKDYELFYSNLTVDPKACGDLSLLFSKLEYMKDYLSITGNEVLSVSDYQLLSNLTQILGSSAIGYFLAIQNSGAMEIASMYI